MPQKITEQTAATKSDTETKCKKCEEYLNLAKRARADYENFKKDAEKWKQEFIKYANEGLIIELFPILDNFQEAMSHVPEEEKSKDWVIGITYIKKQVEDLLKAYGVEIYGQIDDNFDPHLAEAVAEVQDKERLAGKVVKVVRKGFKLHGKVVRAAQVVVAK